MSSRDLGRNDRVSAPAATKLYYEPNCRWEVEGFEYDGDLRSKVVDSLLYGAEIFGWKEREKMEVIQNKYIKWCLSLERSTPEYIVLEETKREKLRIRAGKRAMKFEEGIKKAEGRKWVKECLKERREIITRIRTAQERIDYLRRNGYSQEGLTLLEQEGREVYRILEIRDKEIQEQVQYNKIRESKYNRVYKHIRCIGIPEYLSTRGEGNSQSLIARARCGNIEENNKY